MISHNIKFMNKIFIWQLINISFLKIFKYSALKDMRCFITLLDDEVSPSPSPLPDGEWFDRLTIPRMRSTLLTTLRTILRLSKGIPSAVEGRVMVRGYAKPNSGFETRDRIRSEGVFTRLSLRGVPMTAINSRVI